MNAETARLKLLFIINPGAGNGTVNYKEEISAYFSELPHKFQLYELHKNCKEEEIRQVIKKSGADRVIAVGGDGTLKLIAECQLNTNLPIGIIPGGSANGMAKELGISMDVKEALETAINSIPKKIHVVMVNNELCIHLSDIGFNAYVIKKFDDLPRRGMWAYAKATWYALWHYHKMDVTFKIDGKKICSEAAMVVIANATMYGTGVKINPEGKLDDGVFEVILVKKYSILEILKSRFTNIPFNPEKIELFKTESLVINSRHKTHFQVDGEYIGQVNTIHAHILTDAINIIAGPQ